MPRLKRSRDLHPWQKLGVTFLHLHRKMFGFTLLADEMGVGKVCYPENSLTYRRYRHWHLYKQIIDESVPRKY